jgi:uncharacterized membrane protein YccC
LTDRFGLGAALFSLKSYVAAMLALWVALRIGMERPYWAFLTAYIVAQPLAGAVLSKAVFRVIGTMVGAAVTVLMVPALINKPELLVLAFAAWLALCVYVSLLDRTPRSYMFVLAGYSACLIGLPSLDTPGAVFTIATLRVQEILIGILCGSLVHGIVFPRSVTDLLLARVDTILSDASRWSRDSIAAQGGPALDIERRRLAQDVTELHQMSVHLPFETARTAPRLRTVRALQDQLSLLLPLAAAIEDRVVQLGEAMPAAVRAVLDDARALLDPAVSDRAAWRMQAEALIARCVALEPDLGPDADWHEMIVLSLLTRLSALVAAHRDALDLRDQMAIASARPITPRVAELVARARNRELHRDPEAALGGALSAAVTMIVGCALWIGSGWHDGSAAVMMAGVFLALFAAVDNPIVPLRGFLIGTMAATLIGALYGYAIMPRLDGFAMLAAAFAPTLLLLGALLASPRWGGIALPALLGLGSPALLETEYVNNFTSFVNGSLAQVTGIWFAIVMVRLLRSAGASGAVRRTIRAGWRDIGQRANLSGQPDVRAWINRMLDRIGLLAPRLAAQDEGQRLYDALRDLRTGVAIGELRQLRIELRRDAEPLTRVLAGVGDYYRRLDPDAPATPDEHLRVDIDAALTELLHDGDAQVRRDAAIGLVSLRRNLFPQATPYRAVAA